MAARVTRGYGLLEAFLAKKRAQMANRLIPSGYRKGRILDIGCGSVPFFLAGTPFQEQYGIERSPHSSSSREGVRLVSFDLERGPFLPFASKRFDVVTMLAVLEHLDPSTVAGLLNETYRVLKNGGLLIVTTPASRTDHLLRLMAKLRLLSPTEINEHKDTYSLPGLAKCFQSSNFGTSSMRLGHFELGMNIWGLIAKVPSIDRSQPGVVGGAVKQIPQLVTR
jgi:SAM-dependent methyltransferase